MSASPKYVSLRGVSAQEVAATAPPATPEVIEQLRDLLGFNKTVAPKRRAS